MCIDNGRAVFTCSLSNENGVTFESLYALELTSWSTHAKFVASPPKLTNLTKIVPFVVPISQIEKDPCVVYPTAYDARSELELYEACQTFQHDYNTLYEVMDSSIWFDLDGKVLYMNEHPLQNDPLLPIALDEFERCWYIWEAKQFDAQDYQSILSYSFLPSKHNTTL